MERLGTLFGAMILEELGFQSAKRSSLLPLLKDTQCTGCMFFQNSQMTLQILETALRDAILVGVRMMLRLGESLRKLGSFEAYNFVHVVLTDGADNASKTSIKELQKLFLTIGMMIPVKMLTTHFIGVEMDEDDADELKEITALGLENAVFHQSTATGLEKIFTKIIASIKEQKQVRMQAMNFGGLQAVRIQQQSNPYLELTVKKYVVLFTLDRSGSMSGSRWRKVCECVGKFMDILGDNDLVAGIEFNNEVSVITRSLKAKAIENERRQQEECTIF